MNIPGQGAFDQPVPVAVTLKKAGADIKMRSEPSIPATGHLLVSGEVVRKTPFGKGMPGKYILDTVGTTYVF